MKMRKTVAVIWLGSALLFARLAHAQQPIPPPWQSTDIGTVGLHGDAFLGLSGGLFAASAGSDVWGTADSFHYVYQPIRDGMIVAMVATETFSNAFAKAGVMIRQTLDPGSPQVILDVKPDGGVEFMMRSAQGGETFFLGGDSVPVTPTSDNRVTIGVQLMLARTGDFVLAIQCTPFGDGGEFCKTIGATSFPAGPALVGVAVTSHDPSVLNKVYFPSVPTVESVPNPWTTSDVGAVGTSGFATYESATGTFFVSGAGSDIWDTADSFHIVSQGFNSDNGAVIARVLGEENTNVYAKAGVMMSASSSPDSARVVLDAKPDGSLEFMARPTAGGPMSFIAGASASFPMWLRLSRTGGQVEGSMSSDGESWTPVGSVGVTLPAGIFGALAVTSHNPGMLNAARFDNVSITSGPEPTGNLLTNGGFEDSAVPNTGPGWVSDVIRQSPARSETLAAHGGLYNGACRTTQSLDCGIYQDLIIPATDNYQLTVYASADHPGGLLGVNLNQGGLTVQVAEGGYQPYVIGFYARAGDAIRVWMYAPPTPGFIAIDDASLTIYQGPN
jgi:hypothetical protein